jgi:hypothetical protein
MPLWLLFAGTHVLPRSDVEPTNFGFPPPHPMGRGVKGEGLMASFIGEKHSLFSCFRIFVSPHHHWYLPVIAAPHTNANPPGSSACGASAVKPARADGEFALRTGPQRTASHARSILIARQHQPPREEILPS